MELALIYVDYHPMPVKVCKLEDAIVCIFDHYIHLPSILHEGGKMVDYVNNIDIAYSIEICEEIKEVRIKNPHDKRTYKWSPEILWHEWLYSEASDFYEP